MIVRNKDRREELLKLIELEIEDLLEWEKAADKPTLSQIEEVVLAARQRIGITLTENLVAAQQAHLESEETLLTCISHE